jgi:hypothetical protein
LGINPERRRKMLFMIMSSWTSDMRDEIIRRRLEKGLGYPKEVKVLGEWTAIGPNMDFVLVEADDPKAIAQAHLTWSDILELEVHLVLDTEKDLLGLLK